VGTPSPEELRDEQRRLRQVRFIVDLTTSILMQGDLTRAEVGAVVAEGLEMARGSYNYQADNTLDPDAAVVGFDTDLSSKEGLDGLALGGGLGYTARSGFGLSVDYAFRHMGVLGGTNFFSATIHW